MTSLPEIEKCWMTEMRPSKLYLGAATILVMTVCLWAAGSAGTDGGEFLFQCAFGLQVALILGYGTSKTTASVMVERAERTWDLQRLTPLSARQLAFGKLLGAPIYAYYLALMLVPAVLIGACTAHSPVIAALPMRYLILFCSGFLWLSLGLLVSAYSDQSVAGASSGTAGALMGFLGLQLTIAMSIEHQDPLSFYGLSLDRRFFLAISAFLFGVWALLAAQWRIGKDLLEPRRFWRIPAFLAFVFFYQTGFNDRSAHLAMILPIYFSYFAGILNSERGEHWKKWLASSGSGFWDRTPAWISASAACVVLAGLATLVPSPPKEQWLMPIGRYPLIGCAFAIRDLAFLQLCRFSKSKNPEVMALVFIALAYFLPAIVMGPFNSKLLVPFFLPLPVSEHSAIGNLLPGAIEAAVMLWLVRLRAQGYRTGANSR
jgi:hypothetical protein